MQKEDDLKDFIYDPSQPIDTIFNHVDRFENICEFILGPILDQCKVNLSYKIISKHSVFMNSLKIWTRRTAHLKTYALVKTFMRIESNDLEEFGGLTIASSNLNQVNILQNLKKNQEEMSMRVEQNLKNNMIDTLTGLYGQIEYEEKFHRNKKRI